MVTLLSRMQRFADRDADRPTWAAPVVVAVGVTAIAGLAAVLAPIGVVIGAQRLVALATMAVGTWLLVSRGGAVELGAGAMAGAGAVAGGIGASALGVDVAVGLPAAAVAGAAVGASTGVLHGRLGRHLGAVTSLTVSVVVVAVWRGLPALGGRAGYHGVPFLAGSDRPSLVLGAIVLAAAVVVASRVASTVAAARAAVTIGTPPVAEVLGGGPVDAAVLGAAGGAIVGVGGAVAAAAGGSAVADAHGASLGILLALAAALGRRSAVAAVAGAVALWGPGIVWPLVPLVGTASPWITTGLVALAWLAIRTRPELEFAPAVARRRGPLGRPEPADGDVTIDGHPVAGGGVAGGGAASSDGGATPSQAMAARQELGPPTPGTTPATLAVDGVALPADRVDLACPPGQVTAVVGPNGAGKSTLLAVLGGQHPGPAVRLGDDELPAGPRRRARAGVGRTWQQPPDVHPDDLVEAAATVPGAGDAVAWAASVLGPPPAAATAARAHAALVALAARRPRVALLDEPAAHLEPAPVAAFLRGLADGGASVVVVEHRDEIVAAADRVLRVDRAWPDRGGPRAAASPDEASPDEPGAASTHPASQSLGSQSLESTPASAGPDAPARDPAPAGPTPQGQSPQGQSPQGQSPQGQTPRPHPVPASSGTTSGAVIRIVGADGEVVAAGGEATEIDRSALAALHGTAPGRVHWRGRDVTRWSTARRAGAGLVTLGAAPVAPDVSVRDHLAIVTTPSAASELLASAPLLAGRDDDPAGWLSGGERQVLSWLQTIAVRPAGVVLDGAARGLDDAVLAWATDVVQRWLADGVAVLVHPGRNEERAWTTATAQHG